MKKIKSSSALENKELKRLQIFLYISVLITLYFNAGLQDPFNSPKMWLLFLLASWALPYISFSGFKRDKNTKEYLNENKHIVLVWFFSLSLLLAAIETDEKFTAIFGAAGRRNGLLSYLSLCIIFLFAAKYSNSNFISLLKAILLLAIPTVIYGYMQSSGRDFIKWDNPYNSIIGTLGNPNFASALMAILSSLLVGFCYQGTLKIHTKILLLSLSGLMIYLIYSSESRQGLLAFFIAAITQVIFFLYFKNKILGLIASIFGAGLMILGILAMLQIGPLVDLIYKRSVSVRGYYWRAALEMFSSNPVFGVGLDRYGAYFKEYREAAYSLNFGFELTSTNAHNVFLQLLATGGIFVGLSYFILTLFVGVTGLKLVLNSSSDMRNYSITVFSAWLAFQAQSIISIDSIGISIWGWILGGLIIGLSKINSIKIANESRTVKPLFESENHLLRIQLISWINVIIGIVFCSFLYRGEISILEQRQIYNPKIETSRNETLRLGQQMKNLKMIDPNYRFMSSTFLITSGSEVLGLKILDELIRQDPRNLDYLNARAGYFEQLKQYSNAIKTRLEIYKYDPWNARNLLSLGKNYKLMGDSENQLRVLQLILDFVGTNSIAEEARFELAVK